MEVNTLRRRIIKASPILIAGITGLASCSTSIKNSGKALIPEKKKFSVAPPGATSIEHFTGNCTACHLCVSACPTQVLQPALFGYGLDGILQPAMDYHTNFCNYECNVCTLICPNGAIRPLPIEKKKITQIGITQFIKENCVVYTNKTDCGACSEHCPTKAVYMVPYIDGLLIPEVNPEICIGCGACEYACPTKPYKAIYVEGNPIHLKAQKPKIKKLEEKKESQEDFPF